VTKHQEHQHGDAWRMSFTTLLRRISAKRADLPAVGEAQRPVQEAFKIGQTASLAFAPREIDSITQEDHLGSSKTNIKLFGLGMLGPNGPLPLHYTELVRERVATKQDHTLANFLDLFHHRALSHQYRAWSGSQAAAGLDRADAEVFTNYIARLAGDEPSEVQTSPLSPHARWASSAHRVRQSRNPDGLVGTLKHFFGVPVTLKEYQTHWIALDKIDQCSLGRALQSSVLGEGAIAGESIPDRQTRFGLEIGPLSLDSYLKLTPSSLEKTSAANASNAHASAKKASDLATLVDWVRAFVGFEYEWEVTLLVDAEAAHPVCLGGQEQLGWSTWMGESATGNQTVSGMKFTPEQYFKKNKRSVAS
jgi:type VI secretion system protein ImpH